VTTHTQRQVDSAADSGRLFSSTSVVFAGPAPWAPRDLIRLAWTTAIGATGLLVAYLEVGATVVLSRQLAWLTVSIGMVVLGGLGNAFFLTEGARRTRARTRRLSLRLATHVWESQAAVTSDSAGLALSRPPNLAESSQVGSSSPSKAGGTRTPAWIELLEETRRNHRRRAPRRP
jgi:hypothetical protein